MAGNSNQDAHAFGSDSFLDVVTNMVGILIVLVMVVGVRIKHAPATSEPAPSVPPDQIQRLENEAEALQRNVEATEDQIAQLGATTQDRSAQRNTLAMLVEERERELALARESLGKGKSTFFDLRRAKATADHELERVEHGLRAAADAEKRKKPMVQIKNYPTPLSQTVFGDEAHFQLLGGRVTWVPLDELAKLCKRDLESKVNRLRNSSQILETVGPVDGFRARYLFQRDVLSPEEQLFVGGRPSWSFLMELVPARKDIGEPFDVALGQRSQFRARLGLFDPRRTTVTLWTYPDCFSSYPAVKEELHRLGFTVAARPTPAGNPISGSNHGSHSQAQ